MSSRDLAAHCVCDAGAVSCMEGGKKENPIAEIPFVSGNFS